jgi:8-hydroxy-5-deazaflavin:NADPH oxidoreductase
MNIAIIGAGKVGGALGTRFAQNGQTVTFGMKEGVDPSELLAKSSAKAAPAPAAAQQADIIFLALPGPATVDVVRSLGDLAGKIIVDCGNPIGWDNGPVWAPPPEGSLAQAVARAAPGARVIKAFNQFGAEFHADPKTAAGPAPVFFAGDDAASKKLVGEIATKAGFRAVDAGPLRNAGVLENVAMLWIHLATVGGQGRNFAFAMAGRAA